MEARELCAPEVWSHPLLPTVPPWPHTAPGQGPIFTTAWTWQVPVPEHHPAPSGTTGPFLPSCANHPGLVCQLLRSISCCLPPGLCPVVQVSCPTLPPWVPSFLRTLPGSLCPQCHPAWLSLSENPGRPNALSRGTTKHHKAFSLPSPMTVAGWVFAANPQGLERCLAHGRCFSLSHLYPD